MKRLPSGLVDGVTYIRDENGQINWFKMIPAKFLYINQEKRAAIEKRLGKKIEEADATEMLDTDYVINAQGIRHILDLRGYKSSKVTISNCSPEYAAASCEITFLPLEDEPEQVFSAAASAHTQNTKSWYQKYLVEASSNRAQARAVRFFLKINCVAQEELGGAGGNSEDSEPAPNMMSPANTLKQQMGKAGKSFADVIKILKDGGFDTDKVTSIANIPPNQVWHILGKLG